MLLSFLTATSSGMSEARTQCVQMLRHSWRAVSLHGDALRSSDHVVQYAALVNPSKGTHTCTVAGRDGGGSWGVFLTEEAALCRVVPCLPCRGQRTGGPSARTHGQTPDGTQIRPSLIPLQILPSLSPRQTSPYLGFEGMCGVSYTHSLHK